VPWLVLGAAAWTLVAAEAERTTWIWFGTGSVAYASGHGIHLAANSVGNAVPGETAHLWDEAVGHAIWYAGVALLVIALARTMVDRPRPPLVGYVLAAAVGATWASNAVGTDTLVVQLAALVVAAGFAAYGWRRREGLSITLFVGFAPAVLGLVMRMMLAL
jgi:hypothetical protein